MKIYVLFKVSYPHYEEGEGAVIFHGYVYSEEAAKSSGFEYVLLTERSTMVEPIEHGFCSL